MWRMLGVQLHFCIMQVITSFLIATLKIQKLYETLTNLNVRNTQEQNSPNIYFFHLQVTN